MYIFNILSVIITIGYFVFMIKRDYHSTNLTDALADAEHVIGQVRIQKTQEQAEFITGFGIIREKLFQLLENYSLEPTYKLNNAGTIFVVIE